MKKKIFISFIIILFLLFVFGATTISLLNRKDSENLLMQEEIAENEIVENTIVVIQEENVEKIKEDTKEDSKDKIIETDANKTKEESNQMTSKGTTTRNSSETGKSNTTSKNTATSKNTTTSNSSTKGQGNTTSQSGTIEEHKQEETIVKEKSIYDYEFDIEKIRLELISVGKSMGLTHITQDEGVTRTPQNSSWASPITGSKNFQGKNLERSLKDYVSSMPNVIKSHGGTEIKYFTIYIQNNGNGSYTFYFLY